MHNLDLDDPVVVAPNGSVQINLCLSFQLVELLEVAPKVLVVDLDDLMGRLVAILVGAAEFDTNGELGVLGLLGLLMLSGLDWSRREGKEFGSWLISLTILVYPGPDDLQGAPTQRRHMWSRWREAWC